jgi:hypothetical protein
VPLGTARSALPNFDPAHSAFQPQTSEVSSRDRPTYQKRKQSRQDVAALPHLDPLLLRRVIKSESIPTNPTKVTMSNRLQVEAQKRRENNARPNLQEGNFTSFETKRYDATGGSGLRIDVSVGGGASGARGGGGGGGGIPYVSPTSQNAPSSSYFDAPRSPAPAYSPGGHGPDEGARLLQAPPSPYRNPNSPIRAQFVAPPSPALSTTSTLVGRDAFPLDGKMGYEERRLSAGPDNDRMAPTGAGGEKGRDFWKRFSTVAHKHEQEQVGSQRCVLFFSPGTFLRTIPLTRTPNLQ